MHSALWAFIFYYWFTKKTSNKNPLKVCEEQFAFHNSKPDTMRKQSKCAKSASSHCLHLSSPSLFAVIALIVITNLNLSLLTENSMIYTAASNFDCPGISAITIPASKLRRYLEVTDGGVHACARFSTRYEASHLIQWLYYHKRIGISFFHLYVICLFFQCSVLVCSGCVACAWFRLSSVNCPYYYHLCLHTDTLIIAILHILPVSSSSRCVLGIQLLW